MKLGVTVSAVTALMVASLPSGSFGQVVVVGNTVQTSFGNTAEERRGIGIAPQASEPAIAPQFNEPMIGQQGPPPFEPGLPQPAQLRALPPGVQAGLSDQGVIFPAPGTIIVGPQGDTTVITAQGTGIGIPPSADVASRAQNQTSVSLGNTDFQPILPQALDSRHFFEQHPTTQERRGIGIAPQASQPAIAPQFNEPTIGQQGPPPFEPGLPQQAQLRVLPPGVQAGLSDQGIIFPTPGTVIVGVQGDTALVVPRGQATAITPTAIVPISPVMRSGTSQTVLTPQNNPTTIGPQATSALLTQPAGGRPAQSAVTPAVSPTGRGSSGGRK